MQLSYISKLNLVISLTILTLYSSIVYSQVPSVSLFDKGSICVYDMDFMRINGKIKILKEDYLIVPIDTAFMAQLVSGIDSIRKFQGVPIPFIYCGTRLGVSADVQIYWKDKTYIHILLSCPNSKLQAQLEKGNSIYGIVFKPEFENRLKLDILKYRLKIFGKNRLFECSNDTSCKDK